MNLRVLALIGATLLAAALGGLAAVLMRDRPPTGGPPGAAETVVTRQAAGASFRVPLPPGHCALDAQKPEDNAILNQITRAMRGNASPDAVVFSVPCDRRTALNSTGLPRNMRIMAFVAVRLPVGARGLAGVTRTDFLARLRDRAAAADFDTFARNSPAARNISTRQAGIDENAYYMRVSGVPIGPGEAACGVMAMTVAAGTLVVALMMENCDSAPAGDEIVAQSRQLAARFAVLNP